MSINDAALTAAATDIFYHLGDDATYYPTNGDPIPCKVNVEKESGDEPDGFVTQAKGEQITLEGPRHILGKVPVAHTPNRAGERFVMTDGTTYEVWGVVDADAFFVTVNVRLVE